VTTTTNRSHLAGLAPHERAMAELMLSLRQTRLAAEEVLRRRQAFEDPDEVRRDAEAILWVLDAADCAAEASATPAATVAVNAACGSAWARAWQRVHAGKPLSARLRRQAVREAEELLEGAPAS
jgi:hypothetical protein